METTAQQEIAANCEKLQSDQGPISLMIQNWNSLHSQTTPFSPEPSYPAHLAGSWTPLSCGMAGCWQIHSILANIDPQKNSNFKSVPIWNILIWTKFICFVYFLIISKIKVALTDCAIKGAIKGSLELWAQLGARPNWGRREVTPITPGSRLRPGKLGWRYVLPMEQFVLLWFKFSRCRLMLGQANSNSDQPITTSFAYDV